ncbi:MAG: hypothetical protein AAF218_01650 [Pseudomonadota bacterium]
MNVNQIINMFIRVVMRKAMNKGIDAGVKAATKGRKANGPEGHGGTSKAARAALRQGRRLGKM